MNKIKTIVENLTEIAEALDKLKLKMSGYVQCKTYANIIESLISTKSLASELLNATTKECEDE